MDLDLSGLQDGAPVAAATPEVALDPVQIDGLLDRITGLKAAQKLIDSQLEPLLDQLDAAFDAGLIDATFSHNDVSFCWSAGRATYTYPEALQQQEQTLKAAQKDAIASGAATARLGRAFWTIRLPRT